MKVEGKGIWKGLSSISFIISAIVMWLGLDKMFNYDSGELYPYECHNAYVGGDAYNYIINGNYATGFFVLATMFALMGMGFIVLYYLSKMADGQEKLLLPFRRLWSCFRWHWPVSRCLARLWLYQLICSQLQ